VNNKQANLLKKPIHQKIKGEVEMIDYEEQKLYDVLNQLSIKFTRYEHEAVYTVEEADNLDIDIPGQHSKNLFLRNKKGNIHYLLIACSNKHIDLKSLSKQIGSSVLSFASEERLNKYLGLKKGAVSPFGLINDSERQVIVLIDKGLTDKDPVNFHPNVNTATIGVSYGDLERFIRWHGNEFHYID
jgi:Ala-tRNA(Pro) deacylase